MSLHKGQGIYKGNGIYKSGEGGGGETGLPPFTIRIKADRALTPYDLPDKTLTFTLVDDTTHTYDLTYENEDWESLFDANETDNSWLIEVVDANLSSVTSLKYAFYNAENLVRVNMTNTSGVRNMGSMCCKCLSLTYVQLLDMRNVMDLRNAFCDCRSLTSVSLVNTASVNNMYLTFSDCISLTSLPLLYTASVNNMNGTFKGCVNVESGALALYTQASTQANPPSGHSGTFTDCGKDTETGLAELQQIPTSWGGLAE